MRGRGGLSMRFREPDGSVVWGLPFVKLRRPEGAMRRELVVLAHRGAQRSGTSSMWR
jgi:hypothetical protein